MLYEYVCDNCSAGFESLTFHRIGEPLGLCHCCGSGDLIRCVSHLQVAPVVTPYFNHSVGAVVTSNKDFEEKLRVGAELQSERLGIQHNYTPMYPSEARAYAETTASNDGMGGASLEGRRE